MEQTEKLTFRQATQWFAMAQLGSVYLNLPGYLTGIVNQDAWISILLALVIHFVLVVPLFLAMSKQVRGMRFGDYIETLLGKVCGKAFMFGFSILWPMLGFTFTLWALSDFLLLTVLPETPSDAVAVLMLFAVICVVRSGVSVIGRTVEILFWSLILFFVIGVLTLSPIFHIENLLPVFEHGMKPILHGSILVTAFPYLDSFLMMFFARNMEPKKWKKAVFASSAISGLVLVGTTIYVIAVLSAEVTGNLTYSAYFLIRTITLAEFVERFEVLFSTLYYITIFYRMALFLYVTADGLASAFRMKDHRPLLLPLSLIALTLQTFLIPNTTSYQRSYDYTPFYPMIFGLLIPLILWIIGRIRRVNRSD
ncbi:endospore germination permease [Paenibacillus sp. M1]|uniref:Endospore germination permease n=1 Tax=Paenibacillus haidiansis TaxID=1574488 RepID=A0ABU7VR65_9BACL